MQSLSPSVVLVLYETYVMGNPDGQADHHAEIQTSNCEVVNQAIFLHFCISKSSSIHNSDADMQIRQRLEKEVVHSIKSVQIIKTVVSVQSETELPVCSYYEDLWESMETEQGRSLLNLK